MTHIGLQTLRVALDVTRSRLIAFSLGELQQLAGIANTLAGAVDLADVGAQPCALAPEFLRTRRVRPYIGIFQLAGYFLEPLVLAVVLKETPVTSSCARRDL
jgi:hypothetical protein